VQSPKHESPITSSDCGKINFSSAVELNAFDSISRNREFGSNVTSVSDKQQAKHEPPSTLIEFGKKISVSLDPKKALTSICSTEEGVSNLKNPTRQQRHEKVAII
jgi:hypothetical protein